MKQSQYDQLAEIIRQQGSKIDRIHEALTGDELGTYVGLIKEQKADNEFKKLTSEQLNTIIQQQTLQLQINADIQSRVSSLENLVLIVRTFGKLKKSTLFLIGMVISGLSLLLLKFQLLGKWFWQIWQNLS